MPNNPPVIRQLPLNANQTRLADFLGLTARSRARLTDKELARLDELAGPAHIRISYAQDLPQADRKVIDTMVGDAQQLGITGNTKKALALYRKADKEAWRATNGYAKSLSVGDVTAEVKKLKRLTDSYARLLASADAGMTAILTQAKAHPKAGAIADPVQVVAHLNAFADVEVQMRTRLSQALRDKNAVAKDFVAENVEERIAAAAAQLRLLADLRRVDVSALNAELAAARATLQRHGKPLAPKDLQTEFTRKSHEFEVAVKQIKDLQQRENRDAPADVRAVLPRKPAGFVKGRKGPPLAQTEEEFDKHLRQVRGLGRQATPQEGARLLDDLAQLQKHRDDRFRRAMREVGHQSRDDRRAFAAPKADVLGPVAPPLTFDLTDVIEDIDDLKTPSKLETLGEAATKDLADKAASALDGVMKTLAPGSDQLVDLGLKGTGELRKDLAECLGIDLKEAKPGELAVLTTMAQKLDAAITEAYPDKSAESTFEIKDRGGRQIGFAPPEFTLGDKKYANPKYLASGGFGHVLRYEDVTQPGQYLVLKTLKGQDDGEIKDGLTPTEQAHAQMAAEVRMHRRAGGAHGHPNVIGFKGLMRDPKGAIHMAMEFADGGDMSGVGSCIVGAAAMGVLPEEARHVLSQHLFRQAVDGMAHIRQQRLLHRDVKNENFLLAGDGTVKLADFGATRELDAQGGTPNATSIHDVASAQFASPEANDLHTAKLTSKADTYMLGVLLTRLASPVHGEDSMASDYKFQWNFNPVAGPVTALDRLRAAMLDKDPAKRPDLAAVQFSAYLADETHDAYDPQALQNLVAATMAYAKNVGSKIQDDQDRLFRLEGKVVDLERTKKGKLPDEIAKIDQEIKGHKGEMEQFRKKIREVLDTDEAGAKLQPPQHSYVAALKKASAALTVRGPDEAPDYSQAKFQESYTKLVQDLGGGKFPADATLGKLLADVDAGFAAKAPKAQQKAALTRAAKAAEGVAQEAARRREEVAKEAKDLATKDVAKAKLRAREALDLSKYSTELRKLSQQLADAAK